MVAICASIAPLRGPYSGAFAAATASRANSRRKVRWASRKSFTSGSQDWPPSTSAGIAKPWVVVGAGVYIVIS